MVPEQKEKLLKLALRLFGVVHAAIVGVQAFGDKSERRHLVGDVPALLLVAVVPWLLSSQKPSEAPS